MDTTEYAEGQFWTPELIQASPSKLGIVVSEAEGKEGKFGKELQCQVSIDRKVKTWKLNRDSVKNMQSLGKDSKYWIEARVTFQVVSVNGKLRVVGTPVTEVPVK